MPFFIRQKMQILSKIWPKNPKFCHFSPSENKTILTAVNLLCAVNLFYKILPKQFQSFSLPFFLLLVKKWKFF